MAKVYWDRSTHTKRTARPAQKVLARKSTHTTIIDADGVQKNLPTPHGRTQRYIADLKSGTITSPIRGDRGKRLTKGQKAFRSGYVKAQQDNAKAFKASRRTRGPRNDGSI